MPFDFAWDFRNTSGFVTDPLYGTFASQLETYPNTYTNGNGLSINAGWAGGFPDGDANRVNTNDPRIAGIAYQSMSGGATKTFQIDLSSGSGPGASTLTIDCAFGDASNGQLQAFAINDNVTTLIDGTNGGSGFTTATGHFIDASLADVAATTTWTGTGVSKVFASTTAKVILNPAAASLSGFVTPAHFRLTVAAAAAAANFIQEHIGRGIGRGIFQGR